MVLGTKTRKQAKNRMVRRINEILLKNFFTIPELIDLPERKAISIIRLIAKAEGSKLKRQEAKEILEFFIEINDKHRVSISTDASSSKNKAIFKLFNFVKDFLQEITTIIKCIFSPIVEFIFNFRISMRRILRL